MASPRILCLRATLLQEYIVQAREDRTVGSAPKAHFLLTSAAFMAYSICFKLPLELKVVSEKE